MNDVNNKQIGGSHYKNYRYEHWDFATDVLASDAYLKGCCSKYIARYKYKNGMEDLQKAKHYLEKLMSTNIKVTLSKENELYLKVFCEQLDIAEAAVIFYVYQNEYDRAMKHLNAIIEEYELNENDLKHFGVEE